MYFRGPKLSKLKHTEWVATGTCKEICFLIFELTKTVTGQLHQQTNNLKMNEFLSGIIEAALNYAKPLPLTPEVRTGEVEEAHADLPENEVIQEAESITNVHSIPFQEFNAYGVPYSNEVQKDVIIMQEPRSSSLTSSEVSDEFLGYCEINPNVAMATDINFNKISTTFQSIDTRPLQQCSSTDILEQEHHSPLKALIESSPGDSNESKTTTKHSEHMEGEKVAQSKPVSNAEVKFDSSVAKDTLIVPQNSNVSCVSNSSSVGSDSRLDVKKKRTRKREVNPDRSPPPQILPPCRVCDEKSSGFHYGANTCEACKGFFRRTLKKKEVTFQCKCSDEERAAWKRGPYKNGCPACRYERCLCIGMSKNAIKIGRYTLNRKTENIKEVKSLEAIDTLIQDAITEATNDSASSDTRSPATFMEGLQLSPGDVSTPNVAASSPLATLESPSTSSSEPPTKKKRPETTGEDSQSYEGGNSTELTLQEIDATVKTLVEGQVKNALIEPRNMEAIRERHDKCLEQYTLKTAMFGNMTMSNAEYMEFYRTTGLLVDNRFEDIHEALTFFESRISRIVGFAKSIPGFKQLDIDDQANLIKESRVESMLVHGYKYMMQGVDPKKQVIATPWGKEYHVNDFNNIIPKEIILRRHELAQVLGKLELTAQEEAVLRAMVVTAPDRCALNSPEKAEQIHLKLLSCLQHLLSVRPNGAGNMLYKIFNLLVKFREFSDFESKITKKLMLEFPNFGDNFHLLSEFLR